MPSTNDLWTASREKGPEFGLERDHVWEPDRDASTEPQVDNNGGSKTKNRPPESPSKKNLKFLRQSHVHGWTLEMSKTQLSYRALTI